MKEHNKRLINSLGIGFGLNSFLFGCNTNNDKFYFEPDYYAIYGDFEDSESPIGPSIRQLGDNVLFIAALDIPSVKPRNLYPKACAFAIVPSNEIEEPLNIMLQYFEEATRAGKQNFFNESKIMYFQTPELAKKRETNRSLDEAIKNKFSSISFNVVNDNISLKLLNEGDLISLGVRTFWPSYKPMNY